MKATQAIAQHMAELIADRKLRPYHPLHDNARGDAHFGYTRYNTAIYAVTVDKVPDSKEAVLLSIVSHVAVSAVPSDYPDTLPTACCSIFGSTFGIRPWHTLPGIAEAFARVQEPIVWDVELPGEWTSNG